MNTQSMSTIAKIETLKIDVSVYRSFEYSSKGLWGITLKYTHEGSKVECHSSSENLDVALAMVWEKFEKITGEGVKVKKIEALAGPIDWEFREVQGDEIPF